MNVHSTEIFLPFPNDTHRDDLLARRSGGFGMIARIGLLLLFTLCASLFWFKTLPAWRSASDLSANGQMVEARVESHRTAKDGEGNTSYYVTYGFQANETGSYSVREQRVSHVTYERLEDAAPVQVRYLAANAAISTLAEDRTEYAARAIGAGLNAAAAIAALIGIIVMSGKRHGQHRTNELGVRLGELI